MTVASITTTYRFFSEQGEGIIKKIHAKLGELALPQARWLHRKEVTSNQVTASRMLSIVPICVMLAYQRYWLSCALVLLAAWTDNIDGRLARIEDKPKGSMGGLFDSLVDKLFVIAVVLTIYFYSGFRAWFMTSIVIGESVYLTFAVLYLAFAVWFYEVPQEEALKNLSSNSWGRAKLTLEICATICIIIFLNTNSKVFGLAAQVLGWCSVKFLIFSFFGKLRRLNI